MGCYKRRQGFFICYFIRILCFLLQKKQLATKIKSLLQAAAILLVAAATSNFVEVSAYLRGCFMSSFIKILQILFEIKLFATKFHQKCCILQQPDELSMPRPFQNDRAGQNTPSCQISYFKGRGMLRPLGCCKMQHFR